MSAVSSPSRPNAWSSKTPSGYKSGYQQQFTPEQMLMFQQQFGHLGPDSFLGKIAGGDEAAFSQMEAPAWRDFAQAQGQLASRFSGMGMGAQKSSGFRNTMGQLGSDFAQNLQSKRMEYRRQALNDLLGYSNQILGQRPYEQFMVEKGPSNFEKAMNYITPIASSAVGGFSQGFGQGYGGRK